MYLDKIVHYETTHLGFCNALVLGVGRVWLDPYRSRHSLVWHYPWPPNIIADLVLATNLEGQLTNCDLELATLVLHMSTLLLVVPEARMAAARSGSDNSSTIL